VKVLAVDAAAKVLHDLRDASGGSVNLKPDEAKSALRRRLRPR
jgi:hypothetical protein